jgi:ribosomal protein L12E/L44/L45/RPP1/RPP2
MEYVYAVLMLDALGQQVTEKSVKALLEAAQAKVDDKKVQKAIKKFRKE